MARSAPLPSSYSGSGLLLSQACLAPNSIMSSSADAAYLRAKNSRVRARLHGRQGGLSSFQYEVEASRERTGIRREPQQKPRVEQGVGLIGWFVREIKLRRKNCSSPRLDTNMDVPRAPSIEAG